MYAFPSRIDGEDSIKSSTEWLHLVWVMSGGGELVLAVRASSWQNIGHQSTSPALNSPMQLQNSNLNYSCQGQRSSRPIDFSSRSRTSSFIIVRERLLWIQLIMSTNWACSLAWIGRQSPKLQIAGSNPARSAVSYSREIDGLLGFLQCIDFLSVFAKSHSAKINSFKFSLWFSLGQWKEE